jgi:hypothetical protein
MWLPGPLAEALLGGVLQCWAGTTSLVGLNCWFRFQLVKTKTKLVLIFRTSFGAGARIRLF